ncbi:prolipoprotein diacylglyceryl transferase [Pendulispora brunnea]|uniref:Prolipoprotein diacylglyceryl transferase n=1 Tax=Pendulispora brunnea TaxID=2905690 RepID=A0ABZ2KM76_9BACT
MLPYINVSDITIPIPGTGLTIPLHPFGLLVATGVLIGTALATRRARQRGLDLDKLNSFITWMLVAGFMGGHMLDEIFYHPTEIAKFENGHFEWVRPWSLLLLWEGLSSFGGFIGGLIGVLLWKYYELKPKFNVGPFSVVWFTRRPEVQPVLPFCDLILSVFPVAWIFGRGGCSVVHDHPGARATADALFAVGYPFPDSNLHPRVDEFIKLIHGAYPRYDLGLLEWMFTVVLALAFALTWRRKLPTGTYVVATAFAYAPVRFAMDYLRIADERGADPRYGGLTPAQWSCIGLFLFGAWLLTRVRAMHARGVDPMDRVLAAPEQDAPLPEKQPA